jgi:hypothetical protein
MDIQMEKKLHKAREHLTRARYYRYAQYAVNAADELTDAAVLCDELSDTLSMSLHRPGVVNAVMRIWFDGEDVSNEIMEYLPGDGRDDSVIETISTLRADTELERHNWFRAATDYSYALLANRRRHEHPAWATFKLLHGLGRAFQGQNLLWRAERAYSIAFEGYMQLGQLGQLGKPHQTEIRALLDDMDENRKAQKQMVRQRQWTCALISWAIVLICLPAPEWDQVRHRLHLTIAAVTYIPRKFAAARNFLFEWFQWAIIASTGLLWEYCFGKPL